MYFFSFFTQSTTDLKSDVKRIAKQLVLKRRKDSLLQGYFYAVPHDPTIFGAESMYEGADAYVRGMGHQFFFELDASHSDAQLWKALSPHKNNKSHGIDILADDCSITLFRDSGGIKLFDNDVAIKENDKKNSCYKLIFKLHSRDLDSASKVKLLKSRVPQMFSVSSKDAEIEIRLNDGSKVELEHGSKEEICKVLSKSDWYRMVLAFPNIGALKKVFDQRLVSDGEGSSHLSASFKKFPTQSELQSWMKRFGPPGWVLVPGNYPTKFDFFSPPEDFPPIGIVRYPWTDRDFNDDSYVGLDIVHRKNLPPLIEVMGFHLDNQKAAEKRARYLQKRLGPEFQPYEGDLWERFAI